MRQQSTWLMLVGFGLVTSLSATAAEQAKEEKLKIDQVPAAVKATILKEGGEIADIAKFTSPSKTIYEADVIKDGQEIELRVAPDGKLVSRKIEGPVSTQPEGEETEAQTEGRACVAGAKALAEAKVTMIQALKTAVEEGKGAMPFKADLEIEGDKVIYDVELLAGEKGPEMDIDAVTGKVIKIESGEEQEKEDEAEGEENSKEEQREEKQKAAAAKAMPLAKVSLIEAIETAIAEAPGGKTYKAEMKPENGQPRYEVQVVSGGKCMEVVVDGITRKIIETEPKGSTTPTAADTAFRKSFAVDKANLGPTGRNPYFILEPGAKSIFKDEEGNTLTITVLDETKVVDGVTTRIIEEREETKDGKPEEISRNYFAIDKTSGDVYYFGEDVDEYKDDQVVHPGVWLSGAKGAQFGLMMPAKPKVGDKFYQEIAPQVAMDRAEIVRLDEAFKAPAGTYKCVRVKETSPLEKGASHKLYAPGVGLVKDDEFVLVKFMQPK